MGLSAICNEFVVPWLDRPRSAELMQSGLIFQRHRFAWRAKKYAGVPMPALLAAATRPWQFSRSANPARNPARDSRGALPGIPLRFVGFPQTPPAPRGAPPLSTSRLLHFPRFRARHETATPRSAPRQPRFCETTSAPAVEPSLPIAIERVPSDLTRLPARTPGSPMQT